MPLPLYLLKEYPAAQVSPVASRPILHHSKGFDIFEKFEEETVLDELLRRFLRGRHKVLPCPMLKQTLQPIDLTYLKNKKYQPN